MKHSKNKMESQEVGPNSLKPKDLHPLLVCDIKPDVRPFTWPKRPRKPPDPEPEQPDLFDVEGLCRSEE